MSPIQGQGTALLKQRPVDIPGRTYNTGLYVRLSVEDGGLSKESESLIHQEQFLLRFMEDHPELILTKIYRDNGETGTDFDRPGFSSMMADLRSGVIDCIVVKDLSRFGRDYIQTGEYLEKIFPFMGTRFISILENYDNIRPDAQDMLMVNLKNLMNEAYAKDKSKRICSAFDAKRANGEFNVKYAPYGYLLSGDKRHPYVIDEETAPIVREIFDLREQGMAILAIARYMDEKGYLTPHQYALQKGIRKNVKGDNHWNAVTINGILGNPAYLGHMYMRKTESRMYQGVKRRKVEAGEQFIVFNVNEPIITQRQFDAVNGMKRPYTKSKKKKTGEENVFKGLVFCAECGKPLYRSRAKLGENKIRRYFSCPTYRDHKDKYCSHKSGMREDELKAVVLEFVKAQAKLAAGLDGKASELATRKPVQSGDSARINELKAEIERCELSSKEVFESFLLGDLTEREYTEQTERITAGIAELRAQLERAENGVAKTASKTVKENSYVQTLKTLTRARALTCEICVELIARIDIDKDHNVQITVKYQDQFAELVRIIEKTEAD